jgi:hypothetical protein
MRSVEESPAHVWELVPAATDKRAS